MLEVKKDNYEKDINDYWGDLWKNSSKGLDITDIVTPFKFKYFIKVFVDKLPIGSSVCEIGSGNCQWLLLIKAYRPDLKLYGIDLTDEAIIIGKSYGIEVIQADTRDIPLEDAHFDFVYSWGVIEHMPEYEQAFKEQYRISKMFISLDVPCIESYPGWRLNKKLIENGVPEYEMMIESGKFFTKKEFKTLVNNVISNKNNKFSIMNNYVVLPYRFLFLEKYLPDFIRKKIGHNIGVTISKNHKAK
jgi:hypothetical protein